MATIGRDFGRRGAASISIDRPTTDLCPNCERGTLLIAKGSKIPKGGEGGPREFVCDECGWGLTSNLHGPDDRSPER